jgi:lysophospholipase L1-like esterase
MERIPLVLTLLCANACLSAQTLDTRSWTAAEDHRNMMEQLGIQSLRPGPSGNESAPNHANYDESKANPYPDLPDPLTLKNGRKVTTADQWWRERRPEIVADFEREILGRVPGNAPRVTWEVTRTVEAKLADRPVIGRQLLGHIDNSGYPELTVDIQMTLVLPANAKTPVPVMIMFGGRSIPEVAFPTPAFPGRGGPGRGAAPPPPNADPPATEQLIAGGWGFATIAPNSVQPDNGAGLTKGVIGIVNKGQPRKPDDWGALRAWAWGASRALDYIETLKEVNARQVGIEGVSRYGKAALITMALDQRFAVVLIGSSGEGGAKLHRRNFGEAVENLTGSGEYHWMAGNFLKYGGPKTPGDLPVDAHDLIALCAPRPTFVSYGIPEKGDARWLDQQGSYMATIAAQPVFRLLGARDLGVTEDYHTARMPPYNTSLLDGQLAWRQHDGGHTDAPNWKYFIPWADRQLKRVTAEPRTDANSRLAHEQLLAKAKQGRIDVYFEGDSITRRWGATDYPQFLDHWRKTFHGWNAADFGWGADRVENVLWRLENGELDGINPKVIVLLAGTNNVSRGDDAGQVTRGITAVLRTMQQKAPAATIILTAIFPRNDRMSYMAVVNSINLNLAKLSDGNKIRFLDVNSKLADADGKLREGVMNRDQLHPALPGYEIWAEGLKPLLTELLGPPAAEDHAPPPTGDPSAKR